MKSILDQLTPKDKEALALLYDTEGYDALKRVHKLTIQGLGNDALVAQDIAEVKYLNGRAYQSKAVMKLIKEAFTKSKES